MAPLPTGFTVTTGNHRVKRHAVADLKSFDVRTDFGDHPGRFMAHDQGRNSAATTAVESVNVAAADAAGLHR